MINTYIREIKFRYVDLQNVVLVSSKFRRIVYPEHYWLGLLQSRLLRNGQELDIRYPKIEGKYDWKLIIMSN